MRKLPLLLALAHLAWLPAAPEEEEGTIMRPEDGSALPLGEISIVAGGPGGKLELDGQAINTEEPFPDVFHAKVTPSPGEHKLALVWQGGRREIRFFVGDNAPPEFRPFRKHPPIAVECTWCHGLSRRGRFRFKGGCFHCHHQETFADIHQHPPHILEQCGLCHNAHGSTVKAHLILQREKACKLCHN
ncbi:MAG: hypothetical protein ACE5MK_06950 [Acidobacteriota bacterium]